MGAREVISFKATVASGATLSSEVDIGKGYDQVYLDMASGTTFSVFIQGARTSGGTFKRIYHAPSDNDSVTTAVEIASSTAGTNGAIVALPHHTRFMKLEFATAVANGGTYYFICRD